MSAQVLDCFRRFDRLAVLKRHDLEFDVVAKLALTAVRTGCLCGVCSGDSSAVSGNLHSVDCLSWAFMAIGQQIAYPLKSLQEDAHAKRETAHGIRGPLRPSCRKRNFCLSIMVGFVSDAPSR